MTTTTRTAPRGARMAAAGPADRGQAAAIYLRCHDAGHPDLAMSLIRRNASLAQVDAVLEAVADGQAEPPAPDAPPPNSPPDVQTRLDQQNAQLADHEMRLATIEKRMPEPGFGEGDGEAPAEATAATSPTQMINAGALYAQMRARPAGQKASAPLPAMPQAIQTSAGPLLDAQAIHKRQNAAAAARAGRAA